MFTPSKRFLIFCLCFIAGLWTGSQFGWPLVALGWLLGVWLAVWLSQQERRIDLCALIITAGLLGVIVWQLTGGETWLHLAVLGQVSSWLIGFRNHVIDLLNLALPDPEGSLLVGILLGNRTKLSHELVTTFQIAGLSHLIAVSGYNLTIITANLLTLTRPIWGRWSTALAAVAIVGFVILTGAPGSILRAAVMALTLLLARFIGRPARTVNLLILGVALIAIFEPKIIFDIGFELSVAATYGLIRLTPLLSWPLEKILPKVLADVLAETLGASIVTTPLIVAYFGRISLIAPLTNLAVLPLVPLIMGLGALAVAVLLASPLAGRYVALLTWPLLKWIVSVASWAASLPMASLAVVLSPWATLGIVVGTVTLLEIGRLSIFKKTDEFRLIELEYSAET